MTTLEYWENLYQKFDKLKIKIRIKKLLII